MTGIDDLSHRIGSIETKVDDLRTDLKDFMVEFRSHENRLREMEGFKSYILGLAAVISIIFGVAVDFVKNRIFGGS